MRSALLAVYLGAVALCAPAQSADPSDRAAADAAIKAIRVDAIRAHMRFLSDDLLEGRFPGTPGHEIAARYVATELEGMGVQPAGENGTWFQKVPCRRGTPDPLRSSISLSKPGRDVVLEDPEDYWYYSDVARTDSVVEAPVVFVGYGITAPDMHYDDYAGIDAHGKIVALISNAPSTFPSSQAGYYADLARKARNAAAHGAVGRLEIFLPDDDVDLSGDGEWLEKDGTPHNDVPGIRAWAWLHQRGAEKLFEGAPRSLGQAFAEARAGRPQSFPLAWKAKMHAVNTHQPFEASNVVGKIIGSDPRLRDQFVVYTAHVDHMGVQTGAEGDRCLAAEGTKDRICHGAMDNASGVAALLEIARAYTRLPVAPRRSIVFLFPTGEEDMFEGSDYFAHFPTVPASAMVADINIDMLPGMLYASKDLVIEGGDHSTLIENATRAALLTGYALSPDRMPQMNFFARSDNYAFTLQGIPSVQVRRGNDGIEVTQKWLATRYHTPLDNMEQPIDYEAGVRATGMIFLMGYDVAQQEKPPAWNANDFFARPAGKAALPPAAAQIQAAHDAEIRALMETIGMPGLQTAVVKNGRIVRSQAYGNSVLEPPGPRAAMTTRSLLMIGSVSKPFITTAILREMERGRLALDDDINRYVPFPVRNPHWPDVPITWRMLLTHTSSINDDYDALLTFTTYGKGDPTTTLAAFVQGAFTPGGAYSRTVAYSDSRPGTQRVYCNVAYDLAAYAIERLTGEPFPRYVEREILAPLGMEDTGYYLADLPAKRLSVNYSCEPGALERMRCVPARVAFAHQVPGRTVLDQQESYPDYACGRIRTSAEQYAKFVAMLLNGGTGNGVQILKPSSVDAMVTPSGFVNLEGWLQGVGLTAPPDGRGGRVWGHDGEDWGVAAAFSFDRASGVGAVAFGNSNIDDYTLTARLMDLTIRMIGWYR